MSNTAPAVATKHCTRCDTTKNLSEFHRNKTSSDGLSFYCAECSRQIVRESEAKMREEMGEEAYRRHRSRIADRSRLKPEVRERINARNRARTAAIRELRDRHRDEYEYLLLLAKRGEL